MPRCCDEILHPHVSPCRGPGPAVHLNVCEDDEVARRRAFELPEIRPLAIVVDTS